MPSTSLCCRRAATRHPPRTTRHAPPRTTRHLPRTTRHAPSALHRPPRTARHWPRATARHVPRTTRRHAPPPTRHPLLTTPYSSRAPRRARHATRLTPSNKEALRRVARWGRARLRATLSITSLLPETADDASRSSRTHGSQALTAQLKHYVGANPGLAAAEHPLRDEGFRIKRYRPARHGGASTATHTALPSHPLCTPFALASSALPPFAETPHLGPMAAAAD
eukprot:1852377-Prymnesium_polylepis.1